MKLKVLATLSLLAVGAHSAFADGTTLRVGTEGDYPPWSIADAGGKVSGFDIDTANMVCAKLKMKCAFVVQAFDGLIPALNAKRFDVIVSGMSITKGRMESINFSRGYAELPNMFLVKKDSPVMKAKTIDELLKAMAGKSIGAQSGTTHQHYLEKHLATADIKTYDSLDKLEIDMSAGRLDAMFADGAALDDFLAKPDGAGFAEVPINIAASTDPEVLGLGAGIGIRKDDAALKAKIDTALCDLTKDGSLPAASIKWFKRDITVPCK